MGTGYYIKLVVEAENHGFIRLIIPYAIGFFVAAIGIVPPGLINMTAAKVSIKDGRNEAISFAIGATIIIFFQSLAAVLFANFINSNSSIVHNLQEIGLLIFFILTIYFLWKAKKGNSIKVEVKVRTKTNRFFYGMLLASLNLFPIPYYVFITTSLASYSFFNFVTSIICSFVFGIVCGSFLVFYFYILYFKKRASTASFLMNNANYIFAVLTGVVALFTLFKVVST
jgi:threonine/homoserine/homoserine lactone efflux protein